MGNEKIRQQKEAVVHEVADKFRESKATILTDYRGLNVSEATELRKNLREAGVEYRVIKNTMTRRATEATELTALDEHLVGPTAIAFSKDDAVAPAKIIAEFAKKHEHLIIKGGVVEGQIVSLERINELAALPSRDGLLSMLLSVLQAPMRNMAYAVKAVAEQKEDGAQEA